MNTTSLSLLDRLKQAEPSALEWRKLQAIYQPLIRAWLLRFPGMREEADDLTQDVLVVLCRELPAFERRRQGSFRAWLKQITVNRVRALRKDNRRARPAGFDASTDQFLDQLEDASSELSRQWEREHDEHLFKKLVAIVKPDFEETTWNAFTRFALDGKPSAEVAQELGMSEGAVVQAKARVLKRLRQEAGEFME